MLSPKVARQLFVATVAPAMDYASNVWMHARRAREAGRLNIDWDAVACPRSISLLSYYHVNNMAVHITIYCDHIIWTSYDMMKVLPISYMI
jgi:hypothetical protein